MLCHNRVLRIQNLAPSERHINSKEAYEHAEKNNDGGSHDSRYRGIRRSKT